MPPVSTSASRPGSATIPSDGLLGPLTDPRLPRHYTRAQALDYATRTIGKGARLGHQTNSRLTRLKLTGAGRETEPRDNDPPAIQLLIALANAAEECETAENGERGTELDRKKAKMAGYKAALDSLHSVYSQITTMAQAHIRLAQEVKKLDQLNRHHEEEMELKRKALLQKPGKAGADALSIIDDAVQAMSNEELARFRVGAEDTTAEHE